MSGRQTPPVSVTPIDPAERRVAAAPAQTISPERAASFVTSGMWLDYGTGLCQPDRFDRALAARVHEVSNVKIRHCLTMRPRAVLDADPEGEHVHTFSLHFSGYDRKKHDEGRCHYIPVNLGEISDYYRRFMAPSDIVVFKTCPVDEHGYFNLSAANLWHRAIVERARMVIVETSERLPYVYGEGTGLHISEVDYVIEGTDDAPAPELPNPPVRDVDAAVGRLIASEIEDGDCLQIGIGAMPNAVCALLVESGVRDLGVHTEMMTDGLAELYKAGRITGARKQLNPGKVVYTFALGSHALYDDARPQRGHALLSGGIHELAAHHHAERSRGVDPEHHPGRPAGTGRVRVRRPSPHQRHGRPAAVRARRLRVEGRQVVHLPFVDLRQARRPPQPDRAGSDGRQRRDDAPLRHHVRRHRIRHGQSERQVHRGAGRALIGIAHPDFREELERQAHEHRLIPRGVSF